MRISKTFKIALLTIATGFAGYAAADSRADRQNETVPESRWTYIGELPATAAGSKAEAKGSSGMMDHKGMMDHDGMMMSKEACMEMHEKMMQGGTEDE